MAVFTFNALQQVFPLRPAELESAIPCYCGLVTHQNGSGIITLRNARPYRQTNYLIIAKANIALPEEATVSPISIALDSDGGILVTSRAIVSPAAAEDFFNVVAIGVVSAQNGCCNHVSVINDSDPVDGVSPTISMQNLVVTVENI